MIKICINCNTEKDILTKSNICKECNILKRKASHKKWRDNNKDKIKENNNEWRDNNRDYNKTYKENNIDKIKDLNKSYYNTHKEKHIYDKNDLKQKSKRNEYRRIKYATDPLYRLKHDMRANTNVFKKNGYKKMSSTEILHGCTYEFLFEYIQSKFEDWMTWNNKGLYEKNKYNIGWDIDHITPLSKASNEQELIKLFHYTNLQPLCSKINRDIKKNLTI